MKLERKIIVNTILQEQTKLLMKLENEKQDLENALLDKEMQIDLQKEVLRQIKGE